MAVLAGIGVYAGEKPPEAYVALMKEVGTGSQSLRQAVEAKNYETVGTTAGSLKGTFTKVEAFWTERKVDDAIGFAKSATKAATDLQAAATAKDDAAVAAAAKTLTSTCGSCHTAHRERLPDGSFEIK
jgi:cytochrome c556